MKFNLIIIIFLLVLGSCSEPYEKTRPVVPEEIQSIQEVTEMKGIELPETEYGYPLSFFLLHNLTVHFVDTNQNIVTREFENYITKDTMLPEKHIEIVVADKRLKKEFEFINKIVDKSKKLYFLTKGNEDYQLFPLNFERPDGIIRCPKYSQLLKIIVPTDQTTFDSVFVKAWKKDTIIDKINLLPFFKDRFSNFLQPNTFKRSHTREGSLVQIEYINESFQDQDQNKKYSYEKYNYTLKMMNLIKKDEILIPQVNIVIIKNVSSFSLEEFIKITEEIFQKNMLVIIKDELISLSAQLRLLEKLELLNTLFFFQNRSFFDVENLDPFEVPPPPPPKIKE